MMRGFAGSGGKVVLHRCDLAATGLDNARDIAAVIDAMAGQPKIDTSRIVVAGQSFGGWNTLALGTLGRRGVKGLVNFSGGMREGDCRFSDQDASLADGAGIFGTRTRVPSIWFYGDNDMIFPESTWRAMYARYTAAGGGRAELVAYGNFMDDAHQLLSHAEGFPIWTPKVDAFLARIGLPATPVYPGYMPTPLPPATHYADVQDATAVPYLSDNGRAYYQKFLDRPFTRAFAVAPNGFAAAANGGFDPIAMALGLCRQRARDCQLYAVDNDVVWTRPGPGDAERTAASIHHLTVVAGTTATVDFSYGVNRDCSSRGVPKIWLVQPPAHGTARIGQRVGFPRFPPGNPYAGCDSVKVPGAVVEYTPAAGFAGTDFLTFEEINLNNRDLVFRVAITVK